ncbi:MAG: tripartite tricarboxylate transporter TctB family protein [Betaproteobacteria bacterium]|nr:tripartite tricarboxylate transporter TctB family protein [Betaproteobacteria bacterium]
MNTHQQSDRSAASSRALELVIAGLIFIFGAAVVFDSWRLGARWGDDGPESGYFPFYLGLLILVSSGIVFYRGLGDKKLAAKSFVSVAQLKLVLLVLAPSVIYVGLIQGAGIYLASMVFIGFFMMWLGKYGIVKTLVVSVGVMVAFFLVFEVWFKVPLPKGPIEVLLGLA